MRASPALVIAVLAAIMAGPGTPTDAHAQGAGSRPMRIIVPFVPGGGTDIVARIVAPRLSERLGHPVVVDNRPGAAGSVGAEMTAKSAPDGSTMLMGSTSEIGIAPSLSSRLPYDVFRDFLAVTAVASTPMVLVVHPSLPVRNAKELVALAKAKPGQLNYGSAGAGTGNHMSGELFRYITKVDIAHISYKGAAPALTDVVGGQIHMMFSTLPAATGLMKAGRLKALAVSSAKRVPTAPEVPTMAESGVPGYEVEYWYGLMAPAATPRDLASRVYTEMQGVLKLPEIGQSLAVQGLLPMQKTQEQFAAFVKADVEKWAVVVKASGAKQD